MASEQIHRTIIYAPAATEELYQIWCWNVDNHSTVHADEYLAFLKEEILKLAVNAYRGRPVETLPGVRHVIIRRKLRGHGHVAVYQIKETQVNVLHVYHTAQDWQNKLDDEL